MSWMTVVVRVSMRPWSPSIVVSWLVSVSANPRAFYSVANRSTSSRSDPWLPLKGEHVIGLLVDHLPCNSALAPHCVDGDDCAFNGQHVEQLGDSPISLAFSVTLTCPSTRRWRAAKAETLWMAALAPFFWPDRRMVLPSIAITSVGTPATAATQATKQL